MLGEEKTNINSTDFLVLLQNIEPTTFHAQGEHAIIIHSTMRATNHPESQNIQNWMESRVSNRLSIFFFGIHNFVLKIVIVLNPNQQCLSYIVAN